MIELINPTTNETFKPGKIICIGRNYAKHIEELNNERPSSPVVFLKPSSSLISSGASTVIPNQSKDVHHEVELVCLIGKTGRNISREEALDHIDGYAVGLDFTARDLQSIAKEKGLPWSIAKGFDTFAPLGSFVASKSISSVQDLSIQLHKNDELVQDGHTGSMLWPVAELVESVSSVFTLESGDLLFTGTPAGVGPVVSGDKLVARIPGLPELHISIA